MKIYLIILFLFLHKITSSQDNLISLNYSTKIQIKQIVDKNFVEWSTSNASSPNWESGNVFRYFDLQRNSISVQGYRSFRINRLLTYGISYNKETFSFFNAFADTLIESSPGKSFHPELKSYGMKYFDLRFGIGIKWEQKTNYIFWHNSIITVFLLEQFANYYWPINYHNYPNVFSHIGFRSDFDWFIRLKDNNFIKPFIGLQLPYIFLNKNFSREQVNAFTLNIGVGYSFGWDKKKNKK